MIARALAERVRLSTIVALATFILVAVRAWSSALTAAHLDVVERGPLEDVDGGRPPDHLVDHGVGALVEPELTIAQVTTMHVGLLQFLLERVNELSGVSVSAAEIAQAVDAPLAKATFVLAEEFGWTPQEVGELTLGQVLLHLKMLGERPRAAHR